MLVSERYVFRPPCGWDGWACQYIDTDRDNEVVGILYNFNFFFFFFKHIFIYITIYTTHYI
jgi:hypothetical protein